MNKLWHSIGNGFWQLLSSAVMLVLSMAIVRLFSASVWGTIVGIIVIQQIANSILSWGNRDFLQRELAADAAGFNAAFSALFVQRMLLIPVVLAIIFFLKAIEPAYFFAFVLLVCGRFWQQSFDIVIIRERKFVLAIGLELTCMSGQIFAIVAFANHGNPDVRSLLAVFWIPALLKGLVLSVHFRRYFSSERMAVFYIPQAFFFAVLAVTGLVHSKIDLLLVSRLLDDSTLGQYQVITAFLWSIQSVAMYVSGPFVHNFYRLNESAKRNSGALLRRVGIAVIPFAVGAMLIVLDVGFQILITWRLALIAILFSSASFIYLPWIFRLNQQRLESRVLLINILGTLLLAAMLLMANRFWILTLETTLWIATVHQLIITFFAFAANKTPKYA